MIVGDFSQKMQRCQDYIDALHGERQKILVFQRELPLCLELVTQAIEACKQQLSETTTVTATATAGECMHAQSECNSEQTTSDGPVFEEFIPIKRKPCSDDNDDDEDEQESHKSKSDNEKSDWLGSAQLSLWNQSSDPVISPRKVPVTEIKRSGGSVGAFHPFKREKTDGNSPRPIALPSPSVAPPQPAAAAPVAAASSTADVVGKKKDEKDDQGQRKARRCWSPELHRRFLQALQQLGGSHVATPKQIRDLMKVDGLTNDEVKSHLQKYRLHTRRPTPPSSGHNSNHTNNTQAPQFVVVGGIWVQPQEYASTDPSSAGTRNGVYAPIATPAVPRQQRQQSRSPSHSEERGGSHTGDSNSPANSSSTHTTAS